MRVGEVWSDSSECHFCPLQKQEFNVCICRQATRSHYPSDLHCRHSFAISTKKEEHICWEITFPCRLFPSLSLSEPSWLGQGRAQPHPPSGCRAGGGLTGAQTHSRAPWVPARPQRDFPRAGQHVPKLPAAGFDASVHQFLLVLISLCSTPSFLPRAPKALQHLNFTLPPPAPVLWGFSAKRSLDLQK